MKFPTLIDRALLDGVYHTVLALEHGSIFFEDVKPAGKSYRCK